MLEWPVHSAADLQALRPVDPTTGALGEQLEALQMIRQEVGPDVPILQTVFAPSMVLAYLVGGPENLLGYLTEAPAATKAALGVLRETLAGYAQASLENGADGVFYAIKAADGSLMTRDQYAEFGLPYDRPALDAASRGWFNLLHLCGDQLYFEVVDDLPSAFVSYALSPENPTLAAGRDRAHRAVIGGVSPKPQIREMTPAQVAAEVTAALDDTGGVQMMIGPGCSISPDTPEANLDAANQALRDWARNRRRLNSLDCTDLRTNQQVHTGKQRRDGLAILSRSPLFASAYCTASPVGETTYQTSPTVCPFVSPGAASSYQ